MTYPQTELGGDPGAIRAYGQRVEELGFSHILAYDHVVGAGARRGKAGTIPWLAARWLLCNGMTPEQRTFLSSRLYAESARVILETVDRGELPTEVARTWVMTTRDRILPPRAQRRSIDALGGVHAIESIDACHQVALFVINVVVTAVGIQMTMK